MTYEEVTDDRVFLQRQREWEERRVWVWNLKLRNKSQVEATRKEDVAEGKTKSSNLDGKNSSPKFCLAISVESGFKA